MHISVRHDICYNCQSGVINVENKEKKLVHFEPILGGFSWNNPPNVAQFV